MIGESSGPGKVENASKDGGGGGTGLTVVEDYLEDTVVTKKSGMGRAVSLLTTCYSSTDDNEMSLSASTKIEDLVPPYYVHAGNMHRLIKVSQPTSLPPSLLCMEGLAEISVH